MLLLPGERVLLIFPPQLEQGGKHRIDPGPVNGRAKAFYKNFGSRAHNAGLLLQFCEELFSGFVYWMHAGMVAWRGRRARGAWRNSERDI